MVYPLRNNTCSLNLHSLAKTCKSCSQFSQLCWGFHQALKAWKICFISFIKLLLSDLKKKKKIYETCMYSFIFFMKLQILTTWRLSIISLTSVACFKTFYKIIWMVGAFWLVYKCVFIALWSTKITWTILVSKFWWQSCFYQNILFLYIAFDLSFELFSSWPQIDLPWPLLQPVNTNISGKR